MTTKTSPKNENRVIIWAVDPSQNPDDAKNLVREMKKWAEALRCHIQPVTLISSAAMNIPFELSFTWKELLETQTRKSLQKYIKSARISGTREPEILFTSAFSNRKLAMELADYAEKKKALMVFANTRAKKTRSPIRLGGFAETLAASCRVPLLLMNPLATPTSKTSSILFPTDFRYESKAALELLQPMARALHSRLILFNQVENPALESLQAGATWISPTALIEEELGEVEEIRLRKAENYARLIRKEGLEVGIIVRRQKLDLADEILDVSKKNKADLIALSSHSGRFSQFLLGGVARDLLLQAKQPVLIFYRPLQAKHRADLVEKTKTARALSDRSVEITQVQRH
jgi:nucleotide-binding universal stress UspA family protein